MAKIIVLIDDDQDDLDIMKEAIREMDKTMLSISFIQPEEAILALSQDLILTPDYVFIDINMAPYTGDKCLTELRKNADLDNTKIAMFSTTIPKPVAQKLIESGANYTFEKPIQFQGYRKILEQVFFGKTDY